MAEFKCPLCKQDVSRELFEKITGIWKERKVAEKRFKEQQKEFIKKQKEAQKQLEAERKKMKSEQKTIIEQKIADKVKKYDSKLKKLESDKIKIKEQFDKRIASAVKAAESKAKSAINKELKSKMEESIKKQVEKATSKQQKALFRATQTITATRKQMSTLQTQNLKQQERIKNLETQLKKQTTPQIEGLLYEDKLLEALEKEFPKDKFDHPGKKGDIIHHIIYDHKVCGIIVYECKRVRAWQTAHAEQAARAKLQRRGDYAVLVTNAAKKGSSGFFIEKGVIVINPGGVLAVANILREQTVRMFQLKLTRAQKDEAIEQTLQYLQGPEFKNSLEVVIRKTIELHDDLKKECKDHVKSWQKRHDSLKSVYLNTTHVQAKTTALISGKTKVSKEEMSVQPFPALPDLTEIEKK